MAFSASCIAEVESGGSDTNGGLFDIGNATLATDLAATSANTSAPVVTSASYNFVAGDVGAWVFIKSGTNWIPGFYKIASVASNAATLDAAIGHAVLIDTTKFKPQGLSTVVGCATTASPTAGTWTVDYSQQAASQITFTDLAIDGTTNTKFTSSGNPGGVNLIGNSINVTSGTGFTVQRIIIMAYSAGAYTADKSMGTLSSTSGHGTLGGALHSTGQVGALFSTGPKGIDCYIKTGTYSVTSSSNNVSNGLVSYNLSTGGGVDNTNWTKWVGYGSVRFDDATPPTITNTVGTASTLLGLAAYCMVRNLTLNGGNAGGGYSAGSLAGPHIVYKVNTTNIASGSNAFTVNTTNVAFIECYAAGNGGGFVVSSSQVGIAFIGCVANGCTGAGFNFNGNTATAINCISANCAGASGVGFSNIQAGSVLINCTAYGNASDNFKFNSGGIGATLLNCLAYNASGTNYNLASVEQGALLINCAAGGTGSTYSTTNTLCANVLSFVTLTASPFTSAGTGDFSLNTTAGGGAACRGAGYPGIFPNSLGTTGHADIGAVQHADSVIAAITRAFAFCG